MIKVSIITVCFNSSKTIFNTLNSVKYQNYNLIEHIIVDGDSSDDTLEICKKFTSISKIISEKDTGVYEAFNKGLEIATGDIVGFLNSDDIFYDVDSITKIVNGFKENTDAVYGNLKFFNERNRIVRNWVSKSFEKGSFEKGWMPPHPTFYCRKEIYDKFGNFDESFKIAGDFELMLRFIELNNIKTKFIDKNLIKMKSGGISNSGIISKIKILKEEFKAFKINKIRLNKLFYILNKAGKIKQFL